MTLSTLTSWLTLWNTRLICSSKATTKFPRRKIFCWNIQDEARLMLSSTLWLGEGRRWFYFPLISVHLLYPVSGPCRAGGQQKYIHSAFSFIRNINNFMIIKIIRGCLCIMSQKRPKEQNRVQYINKMSNLLVISSINGITKKVHSVYISY